VYFPWCVRPTGGGHGRTYNEVPRNAEGAQSEGRAKEIVKERDQEQYKGRNPDKDPGRSHR
jgi:hypothetical protein